LHIVGLYCTIIYTTVCLIYPPISLSRSHFSLKTRNLPRVKLLIGTNNGTVMEGHCAEDMDRNVFG